MKPCSRCKKEKPSTTEFFSPLKKAKDGLHSWCKPCLAEWRREDRAKNKERYAEIEKRRYERHGEKRRAANRRAWKERGVQYRKASESRWDRKRDDYNEARRRRHEESAEVRRIHSERSKRWREENAERISAARKEKWRNATPAQRLRVYFGSAIYHALKANNSSKRGRSWQDLVGYTVDELREHLEKQFTDGMSWDNHGEWHIDHIYPVSSFSYESPHDDEFKKCWALSNLQPLWAADNIRKSNKIPDTEGAE